MEKASRRQMKGEPRKKLWELGKPSTIPEGWDMETRARGISAQKADCLDTWLGAGDLSVWSSES